MEKHRKTWLIGIIGVALLAYEVFRCGRIKPGMRSEDIFRLLGPPSFTNVTDSGIKRCEWSILQNTYGGSSFVITFDADDRAVFVPKFCIITGSDGRTWPDMYTRPEDEARDKARENR